MSATVSPPLQPLPPLTQTDAPSVVPPRRRWWMFALNAVPNLIVFSLLGGVMWLGHHTGWKMPKMAELRGTAGVGPEDWCTEHSVPESECIECRPDLLPKSEPFGFCKEHGVAECVIHHPELAQVRGEPQLPQYDTLQAISLIPRPENNSRNTLHTGRVQFASAESVLKAGIDVDVVQESPMTETITANAELIFDPTRVAHLSPRVPGTVARVFKTLGDDVAEGDLLALVDSAQVGHAKSQLLQAVVEFQLRTKTVDRLRPAATAGALPRKALIEAESALQEAEVALITARQALVNLGYELPDRIEEAVPKELSAELQFLGIPSFVAAALPSGTKTANLIPVRSPYAGMIVMSDVVAGEVVNSSATLFTVADPNRMWLLLHVRQEEAEYLRRGLPVSFRPDDGGQDVVGEVSWISPAVDEQTRTLQVRVVLDNTEGRLRDKTFGMGRIVLREEPHAIVVPREAVQSTNDAHFVFVRDKRYFDENSPKFFHVRQVRIGARNDRYVELLAGALPGEVVATKGSNVLLAQLQRGNLGAGCGCHEH